MRASVIASIVMLVATFAQPVPPATGSLSGVVVSDTATPRPVRRATVRLSGAGATARLVGTDDEGKFLFDALPAGSFTLSAAKPGYVTTFHESKRPGVGPGVLVAVQEGRRTEVTLKLLPGAAISGVVTDSAGRPAPAVTIAAVPLRAGRVPGAPARATTDDRGVYRIYGLAPGEYVVSALPQLTLPAMRGRTAEIVATTDEDVRWAQRASAAGVAAASTTATSPPPRPRAVAYAPVYYPTTTDAGAAATVPLAVGEERTGVDIALRIVPMSRIAGSIVDGGGQPIPVANVTLYPRRREQSSAADLLVSSGAVTLPRATMTPGAFTIAGVAPGEYTLVARTGSGQRGAPVPQEGVMWSVTDVTVDGGLDQTDLVLHLVPGANLSGSIAFDRSTTAPPSDVKDFEVSLVASGTPLGPVSTRRAVVDPSGTFRFTSVPPGLYVLKIAPPPQVAATWTMRSAMARGRDLLDGRFEMKPGTDVDGVRVTFTDRPARITGRLVDAAGGAVARYSVIVFPVDRSLWLPDTRRIRAAPPASDGSFAVAGLPPGQYALAAFEDVDAADLGDPAFLSRLLATAYRFTLAEGETKTQELRVGG